MYRKTNSLLLCLIRIKEHRINKVRIVISLGFLHVAIGFALQEAKAARGQLASVVTRAEGSSGSE